ncbi:MAG: Com family DNA-binding transcriptional regulator [Comamonas sp.]
MQEIRCGHCSRKLAMGEYTKLEIKCPRCGTLNLLRAGTADRSGQSPTPERHRASSKPDRDDPKPRSNAL